MADTREVVIELKSVTKALDNRKVLSDLSFSVFRGETFILAGPSGVGKSVTLKHIVRLMDPDAGTVLVGGNDVGALDRAGLSRMRERFGVLFKSSGLLASMNVYDNVALPLRERSALTEDEIRERIEEKLAVVGLHDVGDRMPSDLSGGMRKRVGLARAIAMDPELVLYDEPTTGIDPITADAIDNLILDTRRQFGVTSVIVTHDVASALKVGTLISLLVEGRIIFSGNPEELKNTDNPYVRQFLEGSAEGPHKVYF